MTFQEKFEAIFAKYQAEHPDIVCTGFDADASSPMDMTVHTETGDIALKVDISYLTYKEIVQTADPVPQQEKTKKIKGGFSAFVGLVLTALYAAFLVSYFGDNAVTLGGYIAYQMVKPHMLCVVVAAIFSAIGFFGKQRWAMLTALILMVAAGVMMPEYFQFVIIQAIFFLISYVQMK